MLSGAEIRPHNKEHGAKLLRKAGGSRLAVAGVIVLCGVCLSNHLTAMVAVWHSQHCGHHCIHLPVTVFQSSSRARNVVGVLGSGVCSDYFRLQT